MLLITCFLRYTSFDFCQDNGIESPVLCILLAENKSFAFYGVNQLRDGVLVLLHHVGQLLLGHRPMIPQQVDEHELFRGKWHLGLAELYGDFFRK